jgi:hypothetical protein
MSEPSRRPIIDSSVTWAATLLAFVLVVMKLLAVSHFSVTTTAGVLKSAGVANVLLGLISFSIFPVMFLSLLAVNTVLSLSDPSPTERWVLESAYLVSLVILLIAGPLVVVPIALVLADLHYRWGPITVLAHRRAAKRTPPALQDEMDRAKADVAAIEAHQAEVDRLDTQVDEGADPEAQLAQLTEMKGALERGSRLLKVAEEHSRGFDEAVANATRSVDDMERNVTRISLGTLAFQAIIFVGLIMLNDQPWLPAESFDVGSSPRIVGYELASDEARTLILRDSPRTLEWVDSDSIVDRRVCRMLGASIGGDSSVVDFLFSSPAQLLVEPGDYPKCSDVGAPQPSP